MIKKTNSVICRTQFALQSYTTQLHLSIRHYQARYN